MLSINRIKMRNFFSFGNAEQVVDLDSNDITLILGQNNDAVPTAQGSDDNSGRRNGVGKSAIIQAIVFALYGKSIGNDIKIPNLVNKINSKNCEVTVDFTKDGLEYQVQRGRSPTFFNFIKFNENTKDNEARGEQKDTQEELNEVLGISQLLFEHLVVLNANVEPFLALGAQKQREMIEELLGITQLTEKANLLKDLFKESKRCAEQEKFKIETLQASNKRIEQSIETLQNNANTFEVNKSRKIEELSTKLNEYDGIDFDEVLSIAISNAEAIEHNKKRASLEERLSVLAQKQDEYSTFLQNKKDNLQKSIDELSKFDISTELENHNQLELWYELESALKESKSTKKFKEQQLKSVKDKITLQKRTLDSENSKLHDILNSTCPLCKSSLEHDESHEQMKVQVQENIKKLEEIISTLHKEEEENLTKEIDEIEIFDMPLKPSTFYSTIAEAKLHEHKLSELEKQLSTDEVNIYDDELISTYNELESTELKEIIEWYTPDEVKDMKYNYEKVLSDLTRETNSVNPYFDQIETLKTQSLQIINYDEYNRLEKLADHQDYLFKLLMNKDSFVRRRIIEQNITFLNARLQYWIDKSGSEHTVEFMNDLSVDINLNGQSYDFKQLSRGERTRVNISLSLAFRDTYEALNQSINLIVVDEMIDVGLDPSGVLQIWNIFNDIAALMSKNVYVISHREELIQKVEHILKIVKEDSFSTIEYATIDDIF